MEYIESDLENKLTLYNIPKGQQEGQIYKRNPDLEKEIESLTNNIDQGVQCRIKGKLPLPKVIKLLLRRQAHWFLSPQLTIT